MRLAPRQALLLSCATLATLNAWAQESFFDPLPVVLTASRLAQSPLDAPAPVTIIDREMINASGFTEVHDLMRLVPGFLVADWPNGSPTVANHGMGDAFDRRIKVLLDGIAVSSPLWGDTLWQDLPVRIDDIDRVEVVRGPHGAAYGANAFQGVINIITRSPITETGTTVISRLDKDGFFDHGVRFNNQLGSPIDWRITASRRGADNFRPQRDERGRIHSQETIRRSVVNMQAVTMLTSRDEMRVMLGAMDGVDDRGYPAESNQSPEWPIRDEKVKALHLHAVWTRSFENSDEFTLKYAFQQHRRRSAWSIPWQGLQIPTNLNVDTQRHEIEAQYSGKPHDDWHFLIGAGIRQDQVQSRRYFDTDRTLRPFHWQTFGSLTWQATERLALNVGGTFEHHDYSGKLFSPRVALNYATSSNSALRLSAGKSYRTPSLMESHAQETIRYQGVGYRRLYSAQQHVEPEQVRHIELGYVAHIPKRGLSLDARIFQDRYDNYLDDEACRFNNQECQNLGFADPAGFAPWNQRLSRSMYYFLNLGRTRVRGAEFTLDWKRAGWGRAILSQSFVDISAGQALEEEHVTESAPYSMTSLLLIKDLPQRWRASLGYYHTHPVHWLNDGSLVGKQDRFDLKISRAFGPVGSDNEIALTVHSVGGRYTDFYGGRFRHEPRLFASVRTSW